MCLFYCPRNGSAAAYMWQKGGEPRHEPGSARVIVATYCNIARRVSLVTAVVHLSFASQFSLMGKLFVDKYGEYCSYGNVSERYQNILFVIVVPILYSYGPFCIDVYVQFCHIV